MLIPKTNIISKHGEELLYNKCEATCSSTNLEISTWHLHFKRSKLMSLTWLCEQTRDALTKCALLYLIRVFFFLMLYHPVSQHPAEHRPPRRPSHSPAARNKTRMSSTVHIGFLPQQVTNQNQCKCSLSQNNERFPRSILKRISHWKLKFHHAR